MKTRIIALVLLLSLALCLTACDDKTTPSETKAPVARDTRAPETQAAGTEGSLHGVLTDDAYVNDMLKLRVDKPEGWTFFTEEQIAASNNLTGSMLNTDVAALLEQNGQVIDMMVSNETGSNNLNLLLQPDNPALDAYSDAEVFELSESAFRIQLKSAGMEISSYESATMKVGGKERTVLCLVLDYSGTEIREYQIWCRSKQTYMGVLTLAITNGSDPQPILDKITIND